MPTSFNRPKDQPARIWCKICQKWLTDTKGKLNPKTGNLTLYGFPYAHEDDLVHFVHSLCGAEKSVRWVYGRDLEKYQEP